MGKIKSILGELNESASFVRLSDNTLANQHNYTAVYKNNRVPDTIFFGRNYLFGTYGEVGGNNV